MKWEQFSSWAKSKLKVINLLLTLWHIWSGIQVFRTSWTSEMEDMMTFWDLCHNIEAAYKIINGFVQICITLHSWLKHKKATTVAQSFALEEVAITSPESCTLADITKWEHFFSWAKSKCKVITLPLALWHICSGIRLFFRTWTSGTEEKMTFWDLCHKIEAAYKTINGLVQICITIYSWLKPKKATTSAEGATETQHTVA